MTSGRLGSSFRDPAGFIFTRSGRILRQINKIGAADYDALMSSGLYDTLSKSDALIGHTECPDEPPAEPAESHRIIAPERIPYISYPYEWCFSQLKDAALLTLSIQQRALEHGMVLKDASAYNVQFVGCKPVFIDTLSFEKYSDGQPWVAYRQFCQHFLGPLALMATRDLRLRRLLVQNIDGLPLDLVARLLPRRTMMRYGLLAHIHAHARSQQRHGDAARESDAPRRTRPMSKDMLSALVESLRGTVEKCAPVRSETEWGEYYADTNYSETSMSAKERLVAEYVDRHVDPAIQLHDLGGNTARFGRIVAGTSRYVVSHDIDELAIEAGYRALSEQDCTNVLPLIQDLTNPSPALGWALDERESFNARIRGQAVMALALIHHIVISNNVPFDAFLGLVADMATKAIIEFVPKEDSQVRRLLASREDIFPDYHRDGFEASARKFFTILEAESISGSERTLYCLRRRTD